MPGEIRGHRVPHVKRILYLSYMVSKFCEVAGYTVEAILGEAAKDLPLVHVDFRIYEGTDHDRSQLPEPQILAIVKWDGCSNWHFDGGNYQLHFCGLMEAENFGILLTSLYEWAAELLPQHKDEILDRS